MKKFNYIYLTTNTINGKIYVGQHSTDNLEDGYIGSGTLLKLALQKYGKNNFSKEILAYADTQNKLDYLEKFYIRKYKSRELENGYNLTDGGAGFCGLVFTDEHRRKIAEKLKGNTHTLGYICSDETKQKISKANKGKKRTEEQKALMSEKTIGRYKGNKNPMYGVHRYGEEAPAYGVKQRKYKYLSPLGEIKEMRKSTATRYYKDWRIIA